MNAPPPQPTADEEPSQEEKIRKQLTQTAGGGKVVCRLCKGSHFTAKCPYKDSLPILSEGGAGTPNIADRKTILSTHVSVETPPFQEDAPQNEGPSTSNTGGKYVPPSMRGGPGAGRGPGESMRSARDDLPTLRVTNISEDTQEQDLRDLFSHVGRVARVYVGRDRETGAGRGFAFVSFEDKATAQRAIDRMNGRGYDNLILNVGWSRKLLFPISYVSR